MCLSPDLRGGLGDTRAHRQHPEGSPVCWTTSSAQKWQQRKAGARLRARRAALASGTTLRGAKISGIKISNI